ncbi:MAG: hypothetical protein H6698_06575 [Myxococcales bacterium]|nr:hypothetical protein [Myxococcales bacterium]MCB9533972.1 hypothetical protein [Myxococcales bacterium]
MNEHSKPSAWHATAVAAAGVTFAAAAVRLAAPSAFPSQDFPGHLAALRLWVEPTAGAGLIEPNVPPTGQAFYAVGWLFAELFDALGVPSAAGAVELGGRAALLVGLAVGVLGAVAVARELPRASAPLAAATMAAAYSGWVATMGFANYLVAFAVGIAGLGMWLRGAGRREHSRALAGAAVLVLGVTGHVLGGGIPVAIATVIALVGGRQMPRRAQLLLVLPIGVGLALSAATYVAGASVATAETLQATVRAPTIDVLRDLLWCGFVSHSDLAVAGALAIAFAFFAPPRPLDRDATGRVLEVGTQAATYAGAVLYLALPLHGAGLAFAAPRVVGPLLVVAALASRSRPAVAALATLALAAGSLVALPGTLAWGERIAAVREAFGPPRADFTFAVLVDDGARIAAPYASLEIGVASYAGGVGAAAFSVNPLRDGSLITERALAERPSGRLFAVEPGCAPRGLDGDACERWAAGLGERVAIDALAWDSVVATGAPSAFGAALARRGYEPVADARWIPRPASLELHVPSTLAGAALVQVSTPAGAVAQAPVVAGPVEGRAVASLAPLPAGTCTLVVGRPDGEVLLREELTLRPAEQRVLEIGSH